MTGGLVPAAVPESSSNSTDALRADQLFFRALGCSVLITHTVLARIFPSSAPSAAMALTTRHLAVAHLLLLALAAAAAPHAQASLWPQRATGAPRRLAAAPAPAARRLLAPGDVTSETTVQLDPNGASGCACRAEWVGGGIMPPLRQVVGTSIECNGLNVACVYFAVVSAPLYFPQ